VPVDIERVDAIAAAVADVYRQGETLLLSTIRDRLAAGLDVPDWQARKLVELVAFRRAAGVIADRIARRGLTESRAAVAAGYRAGRHDAVRELSGLAVPRVRGRAAQTAADAIQALADARVAELRPVHAAILPQAESVYRRAIAGAAARRLTGAENQREAAQGAYAELAARGITGYVDRRGRSWRLTTYVEMGTRTAVTRAAVHGLVDEFTTQGIGLVSVDDVPGECDRCRPYEHEVLRIGPGPVGPQTVPHWRTGEPHLVDVVATLDTAMIAGLFHPNCRHTVRAYLPGVSILLKQGRTADPEGQAARERQRAIERYLRHWREQERAALTTTARRAAAARVARWDAEMGAHIATTGLRRLRYREQIGAGTIPPPGRVTAAARALGIPDR
jgi:hypothetical protein